MFGGRRVWQKCCKCLFGKKFGKLTVYEEAIQETWIPYTINGERFAVLNFRGFHSY